MLKFIQANYFALNDVNGRRNALEQLVLYYGKAEYWKDLLQLARNEKGLTDEQQMDIARLRLAVGDLKTQDDYQEAAQIALVAKYPGEAKLILDKANAAKVLTGERAVRLHEDDRRQRRRRYRRDGRPSGQGAGRSQRRVRLSRVQASYGKFAEAEATVRAAAKGKGVDIEGAKVQLGHALAGPGKETGGWNRLQLGHPDQQMVFGGQALVAVLPPPRCKRGPRGQGEAKAAKAG